MRKYLLFCLAFCVLGCLAQDLIVRPNDPIIYKKEGGAFLWLGDTAWELFHVLDKEEIVHYLDNPDFEIVTMRGIGYKVVKK